MGTVGEGEELWRVRVDLFAEDDDAIRVTESVDQLRRLLDVDGASARTDLGGDQGLGVTKRPVVGLLFWVRADDVGAATTTAVEVARRAGSAHGVGPELYDVTVIPEAAVALPKDPRYPSMPD